MNRCTINNTAHQLLTTCPKDLWPHPRIPVLWVMGDFAKGGTSRYTKELFDTLASLPIDFTIVYISDQHFDYELAATLRCPIFAYDAVDFPALVAAASCVSLIGVSYHHTRQTEVLEAVQGKCFGQVHGTCVYTARLISDLSHYTNHWVACSLPAAKLLSAFHIKITPPFPLDFNRVLRRRSREEAASRWVSPGTHLVTFAGRLAVDKNIPAIVDAVASLPSTYHLLLVGSGYLQAYVWDYAREHLGRRVHIEPWLPAATDYLDAASCFVCSSPDEGGPFTVAEAVAHGTPVCSTSVGIVPEYVLTSTNSLDRPICFPFTPEAIVRACSHQRSLSEQAEIHNFVLARHSRSVIQTQWWKWLNSF